MECASTKEHCSNICRHAIAKVVIASSAYEVVTVAGADQVVMIAFGGVLDVVLVAGVDTAERLFGSFFVNINGTVPGNLTFGKRRW